MIAAITGASSGLGTEFARQLAKNGYDLLLIARRLNLLEELKRQLEAECGVHVDVFAADLANSEDVKRLEKHLAGMKNLEVLVNNAGFGLQHQFPDVDIEREVDMISVHCIATLRLSQAALLPMRENKKGYIINVSSVAAYLYGAAGVQYYATKAYVLSFSKSLQCDVANYGIRVQALCPGFVHTGFHDTKSMQGFDKKKTPNFLWLPAEFVVRKSLSALKKQRVVCVPSIRYKLLLCVLTSWIAAPILSWMGHWRAKKS